MGRLPARITIRSSLGSAAEEGLMGRGIKAPSAGVVLGVVLVLGSAVGTAEAAGSHGATAARTKHGPIHGALYKATPFPDDHFELRVSKDGRHAHFVGQFVYSDPGCPTAPSGNEYLTPQNAPKISIAHDGKFFGTRKNGVYRDTISGVFKGASAPTEFKETIPSCKGDKPDVYHFTMKAKK
jgi:hypothetical protein